MPFKSKAQQGYLEANAPAVAKKFAAATPKDRYAHLPEHARSAVKAMKPHVPQMASKSSAKKHVGSK